jgi:hypothetical protein
MRRFNWDEYSRLAGELAARNDEACVRSAISRLYYSVYWRARKQLEKEGHAEELRNSLRSHDIVWQYFYVDELPSGISVGRTGQRLKKLRIDADYNDGIDVGQIQWIKAVETAALILGFLDTL